VIVKKPMKINLRHRVKAKVGLKKVSLKVLHAGLIKLNSVINTGKLKLGAKTKKAIIKAKKALLKASANIQKPKKLKAKLSMKGNAMRLNSGINKISL